ncbi:MAG: UDP-N-acetylglucosamine 2-epimerase [Candidatus Bathyarchaeia archaeon]
MDNKIVICTASRSERGLSAPLVEELGKRFKVEVLELPISFKGAFDAAEEFVRARGKPDLAFCNYDRVEMLGAALAFYLNGVKIAQYHAGDLSGSGECLDDFVRYMITLTSTFQFCNGEKAFRRCLEFLKLVGKPTDKCFEVGSLAFDNYKPDYSLVPPCEYDLVVYNPLTGKPELIEKELSQIEGLIERFTVWIEPNEDPYREIIVERAKRLEAEGKVKFLNTVERQQFLALMEKAERVIGNSSAFFLELPYFGKNHIHIGERNKYRERIIVKPGASRRIAEILEKLLEL